MEARRAGAETTPDEAFSLRERLLARPDILRDDPALLAQLGLRLDAANVIDFGPLALGRVNAAHQRESGERRRLESVARANFGAQAQTHAAVIDVLSARGLADLASRVDTLARLRFGLAAGVLALEGPAAIPAGWRPLAQGQVDLVLGPGEGAVMGHAPTALGLFGERAREIGSVALVRLSPWSPVRSGVIGFGSADRRAFSADMGADLLMFLAAVVERTAARWRPA
jgi:uncharacterized protein YigA (DUF484 family)